MTSPKDNDRVQKCQCDQCKRGMKMGHDAIQDYFKSIRPSPKPYSKIDHAHCFDQADSPCGIRGRHRCCLCEEPVPSPNDDRMSSNYVGPESGLGTKSPKEGWRESYKAFVEDAREHGPFPETLATHVEGFIDSLLSRSEEAARAERKSLVEAIEKEKIDVFEVDDQAFNDGLEKALSLINDK